MVLKEMSCIYKSTSLFIICYFAVLATVCHSVTSQQGKPSMTLCIAEAHYQKVSNRYCCNIPTLKHRSESTMAGCSVS